MTPARNATDAYAQYFMVNGELLLPILKSFAHCTHLLHATRNVWCFQSVRNSRTVCNPYNQQSPAPHQTRQPPRGDNILICVL